MNLEYFWTHVGRFIPVELRAFQRDSAFSCCLHLTNLSFIICKDLGSFVLHLLVGFWWDQVWNRWDGSQLLPSQTPTNHPSWFFGLILTSVPKRKFNKHKIATISSHQNPTKSLYVLSFSFPFHLWKVGFGWDEWLVTCVEKWKLTKTNDDWTL